VPIWTTTPWTLPANQAVALNAEIDYMLFEGPPRNGQRALIVVAEPLFSAVGKRYGLAALFDVQGSSNYAVRGNSVKGAALTGAPGAALTQLKHPFYARTVPLILGEHVSAEDGTGAVHTAPGHGQEDFAVGQLYGLAVVNPVDGKGVFLPDTEQFAGQHVWKANASCHRYLARARRCCWRTPRCATAIRTAGGTARR